MTKSDLIARLREDNPQLSRRDAGELVTAMFRRISEALAEGNRVELRSFGTFGTRTRRARTGRNPRTGEKVAVSAKAIPFFRASRKLHHRLNS